MRKIFAVNPITAVRLAADVLKKMADVEICQKEKASKKEAEFQILLAEIEEEFAKKEAEKKISFEKNHKFLTGTKPVLRRG